MLEGSKPLAQLDPPPLAAIPAVDVHIDGKNAERGAPFD